MGSFTVYESNMIAAFVGSNQEKISLFEDTFMKYRLKGKCWSWSWAYFFFCPLFLLYRKVPLSTLLAGIILCCIPFGNVYLGGYGKFWIYENYIDKKKEIEKNIVLPEECISSMRELGGTVTLLDCLYFIGGYLLFISPSLLSTFLLNH